MAFHKEKLLSCMYIYQKVSKNHPVIKLFDIFGTKLQVWIWTSTSLPGMRLGCSATCSTSICWNEIHFGLTAELFYWGLKIDKNLDKKNADIKWVASELVEVVCYTSVSLKVIHGTRRNIFSFSFVVLCFLVVQWNVIDWIWKISIMVKFSDDHVFSFFPLFLLWMIFQCGFSFYILCLFLCFNAMQFLVMILLCFLEILMWNSLHYTHTRRRTQPSGSSSEHYLVTQAVVVYNDHY